MARKPKTQAAGPPAAETTEEERMQNQIQNGATIEYTPASDVTGGDLIVFPAMVAVAVTDIPAGSTGACAAEGVFELPKDNTALAQGQDVYAKSDGTVSATAADKVLAGKAWADAAGSSGSVAVKINV